MDIIVKGDWAESVVFNILHGGAYGCERSIPLTVTYDVYDERVEPCKYYVSTHEPWLFVKDASQIYKFAYFSIIY